MAVLTGQRRSEVTRYRCEHTTVGIGRSAQIKRVPIELGDIVPLDKEMEPS